MSDTWLIKIVSNIIFGVILYLQTAFFQVNFWIEMKVKQKKTKIKNK